MRFSHVIELRPDLCASGLRRFVALAARSLSHSSAFPLVVHDLAAAYPRWAAPAFASMWRFGCEGSLALRCLSVAQHKRLRHLPLDFLFHSTGVVALDLLNYWAPDESPSVMRRSPRRMSRWANQGAQSQVRPSGSSAYCAIVTSERRCVLTSVTWAETICPS